MYSACLMSPVLIMMVCEGGGGRDLLDLQIPIIAQFNSRKLEVFFLRVASVHSSAFKSKLISLFLSPYLEDLPLDGP